METDTIIEFKDGTILNCKKNGTCFITASKDDVPKDVNGVHIVDDIGDRILKYAYAQECFPLDNRYWFGLHEISQAEHDAAMVQANLIYLSMMTGVDLED